MGYYLSSGNIAQLMFETKRRKKFTFRARLFKSQLAWSTISENFVDNFPALPLREVGIFFNRFWMYTKMF